MLKLISFLAAIVSLNAFAMRTPVNSLNDLPSKWDGVSGNLFEKSSASFEIQKIIKVSRDEQKNSFVATYEVQAVARFGQREFNVVKIELSSYAFEKDVYTLILDLNDELTPKLFVTVTYDEASNRFTMRDNQGGSPLEKRFVLTGKLN
jgi:hypothetical protein